MTEAKGNRVSQWLAELGEAKEDEAKAKAVLNAVRDSTSATEKEREDFFRALAQQSFVWYLEALRGETYSAKEMQFLVLHEAKKNGDVSA